MNFSVLFKNVNILDQNWISLMQGRIRSDYAEVKEGYWLGCEDQIFDIIIIIDGL